MHEARATIELDRIAERLRDHLSDDPPAHQFDDTANEWLTRFLDAAAATERQLLPRRLQRALQQMLEVTEYWAQTTDDIETAQRWRRIHRLAVATRQSQTISSPTPTSSPNAGSSSSPPRSSSTDPPAGRAVTHSFET